MGSAREDLTLWRSILFLLLVLVLLQLLLQEPWLAWSHGIGFQDKRDEQDYDHRHGY
jgi:hypothetical protein